VHVFQDGQPSHQPCWQRRPTGIVVIDRAKPIFEKPPIHRACQLRKRMVEIYDLIEPGLEQIFPVYRLL
jgi:hypothetical protein